MIDRKAALVTLVRGFPIAPVRPAQRLLWKWVFLLAAILGSLLAAAFALKLSGRGDVGPPTAAVMVQEVRLGSRLAGRVAAVHVQAGQRVQTGQVLITFEGGELTARRDQAQSRLVAAQAALKRAVKGPLPEEIAEARAAAAAARARLERERAGSREEHKRQAQAERDGALADKQRAEADFARAERLLSQRALAAAEYDAALAARDRARHRAIAAQAGLDLLLNGSRPEEVAEAQAEFDRLQARFELVRRGTRSEDRAAAEAAVALAEAQLAEAEAALRETVVTALEPSLIVEVTVRPGSVVAAGQPLIVAR